MSSKVDKYIKESDQWNELLVQLREMILDCGLKEEFKWNKPCYSFNGSNIVVIQGFKKYCALLFVKGVLLDDPENILVKTGKNTRVGRQIRFKENEDTKGMKSILKKYIKNAIEVEKKGLEVNKNEELLSIPKELKKSLNNNSKLKKAFDELTKGRKRGYLLHFNDAKKSETRKRRIKKCTDKIIEGKGLNEQ